MAFLYVGPTGKPWTKHSYSAGNTFSQSPYKYFLQKVQGWKERDVKGSFAFGRALEQAIQHYHEHNGEGAVEKFIELWAVHKDNKEMTYTKTEKDWASLNRTGMEMIRLYKVRQPSLPIPLGGQTVFQREYSKTVFENDPNYGGIDFAGKLDIISWVEPNHPLLPRLDWKEEYGMLRPVVLDIKTSAVDFPELYGLAAQDLQLRSYSWVSGIRDVGFVWFVKKGHSLQKGSSVTLLEDRGLFKAGQEAVIALIDGETDENVWLLANDFLIEEMNKAQGQKNGKTEQTNAAKERRAAWLLQFGTKVAPEDVTKQRLQFNAGYVSIESAADAGAIAAQQIINIVNAWHQKSYPNTFGVRFPRDDRNDPYFRAFVLGDEAFKKINFVKSDEDTLDDLFSDPQEDQ